MTQEFSALFTIFGGTGDLAKRKLYPSLYHLFRKGLIQEHFAVIGTARREWSDDYYREIVVETLKDIEGSTAEKEAFAQHFYYQAHNVTDTEHYETLKALADRLDEEYQLEQNRLYYLAMAPNFFGTITEHLKSQKIITETGFNRLIIEKPFGSDYASAKQLNDEISAAFTEEQIYRIDHYLGKEMIQNISAIRFGNPLFEAIWNNQHIANIQVTFAESLGVEERGGYYDKSGALKDMVQNHILQVVSLLAMEKPSVFTEEAIKEAKVKALEAIRIYDADEVATHFVRGQYDAGKLGDKTFVAYRDEPNVDPQSETETFVAGKFEIENDRWQNVPFYIRTGKHLTEKGTRINIVFKDPETPLFVDQKEQAQPNVLTIYIQPTEGFSLTLNGKEIGPGFDLAPVKLDFRHSAETLSNSPEAYEKLILDCLNGDGTNFTHWKEVAQSWKIIDAVRQTWDATPAHDFPNYASATMGPQAAFELLEADGNHWIWTPDEWYKERGELKNT